MSSDSDMKYPVSSFARSNNKPEQTMIERSTVGLDPINEFDESVVIAEGEEKINGYTWYLLAVASMSGLLFGYDTGVISSALVNIGTDIGGDLLTDLEKEWVSSATSVGALFGGLGGGAAMDHVGRKWVLVAGDISFVVGALIVCTSFTLVQIIVGRIVLGFGVGIAAGVCAVYLGELAPTRQRGLVVGVQSVMITGGQLVSYALGAGLTFHNGWRVLFAISIPPAIIQAVALHYLPESPRYSLMKNHREEAKATLKLVYAQASDDVLGRKVDIIAATVAIGKDFSTKYPGFFTRLQAIAKCGAYRRPVIVSSVLFLATQLGGVNSLIYYSATIFQAAGIRSPSATAIAIAGTNLVSTTIGVLFLDRYGRRRTLLTGIPVAIIALTMASMCFFFMTKPTGGKLDTVTPGGYPYEQRWVIPMILMMVLYFFGFSPSMGTIPYTTIELMPLEIRGVGTAISVGFQWAGNILMSSTFLSLMNRIGPSGAFGLYAGILFLSLLFSYFCYPEPSGLSMEETAELFIDGFGVSKARAMSKARKAVIRGSKDVEKRELA